MALTVVTDTLEHVRDNQHDVLTADQALSFMTRSELRSKIHSNRWQRPRRNVVVLHNGPLTRMQQLWLHLFAAPAGSALAGPTAAELDGLTGFASTSFYLAVPVGTRKPTGQQLRSYYSKHLADEDVHPNRSPRRTRLARSLLDMASWASTDRWARACLLGGVQQRLVTVPQLRKHLARRGPCLRHALIEESLTDSEGGIASVPEREFDQIVFRRGLPPPTRQAIRRLPGGRYYLDAEWKRYDAAAEVHGVPHWRLRQWEGDLDRHNTITVYSSRLLHFTSYSIRHRSHRVGDLLEALLRRGGWNG